MTSPGDTALTTLLLSALNQGLPGDTVTITTTPIVETQVKSVEKCLYYSFTLPRLKVFEFSGRMTDIDCLFIHELKIFNIVGFLQLLFICHEHLRYFGR